MKRPVGLAAPPASGTPAGPKKARVRQIGIVINVQMRQEDIVDRPDRHTYGEDVAHKIC